MKLLMFDVHLYILSKCFDSLDERNIESLQEQKEYLIFLNPIIALRNSLLYLMKVLIQGVKIGTLGRQIEKK